MSAQAYPSFELVSGAAYGPLDDPRFGRYLGVNLSPDGVKVCGFNCNYCYLDWTFDLIDEPVLAGQAWATPAEIASQFRAGLEGAGPLDRVVVSGNGEPTLHPEFHDVCQRLVEVRNAVRADLPIRILTNGATLAVPQVIPGLNLLDERTVKIDGGSERTFLNMNSPTFNISLEEIASAIPRLDDYEIQSMFTEGRRDNTDDDQIDKWVDLMGQLKPSRVQIHTIYYRPADAKVFPTSRERLLEIASVLKERTGIESDVHP